MPGKLMRGKECYDIVDSVRTDKQGRFDIDFITAGNATEYQVSVYEDESFMNASREEVTAGISNFISLTARELNHIRVEVQIENNPLNPIYLRTASSNLASILQQTRDTVIYGRVLPLAENPLYFTVYDTSINNARQSVDILNIDLRGYDPLREKNIQPERMGDRSVGRTTQIGKTASALRELGLDGDLAACAQGDALLTRHLAPGLRPPAQHDRFKKKDEEFH